MNVSSWLSSYSTELISSLVIAAVAFVLGNLRHALVVRVRTRKTRRYWEPFKSRGLAIVLGAYTPVNASSTDSQHRQVDASVLQDFEPFGLVGFGDVLALLRVQQHLKVLNWDSVEVTHSKDINTVKSKNLVLIGGPDPNPATDLAMEYARVPIRFESIGDDRTQMRVEFVRPGGEREEMVYVPAFSATEPSRLTRDFGFVAQVSSPYHEDATAILLVGTYGAGTAAAAQLVTSSYGVSKIMQVNSRRCLAVFSADISRSGDVSAARVERCAALTE